MIMDKRMKIDDSITTLEGGINVVVQNALSKAFGKPFSLTERV